MTEQEPRTLRPMVMIDNRGISIVFDYLRKEVLNGEKPATLLSNTPFNNENELFAIEKTFAFVPGFLVLQSNLMPKKTIFPYFAKLVADEVLKTPGLEAKHNANENPENVTHTILEIKKGDVVLEVNFGERMAYRDEEQIAEVTLILRIRNGGPAYPRFTSDEESFQKIVAIYAEMYGIFLKSIYAVYEKQPPQGRKIVLGSFANSGHTEPTETSDKKDENNQAFEQPSYGTTSISNAGYQKKANQQAEHIDVNKI